MGDADSVTGDSSRHVLRVAGVDVLSYLSGRRDGRPLADLARPLMPVADAAPLILTAMPGWTLAADADAQPEVADSLTDALIAGGASVARHVLGYTRDLRGARPVDPGWADPPLAHGLVLSALTEVTIDLVELNLRAFPSDHPDHIADERRVHDELAGLLEQEDLGPVLPGTAQVLLDGRAVAALVVNRFPGSAPYGGPWVTEVFRDPHPSARGLGALLLRRAVAVLVAEGETELSLAVTRGNPAVRTYERLGFTPTWDVRRLVLPGSVPDDDGEPVEAP